MFDPYIDVPKKSCGESELHRNKTVLKIILGKPYCIHNGQNMIAFWPCWMQYGSKLNMFHVSENSVTGEFTGFDEPATPHSQVKHSTEIMRS